MTEAPELEREHVTRETRVRREQHAFGAERVSERDRDIECIFVFSLIICAGVVED